MKTIAVVGASLAGLRSAEALRRLGYAGRLVLVGAEEHPPYDRPPLSKEVLRGEWEPERTGLVRSESFDALDLDLRLGRAAVALDTDARVLELAGGERIAFDGLVLATGCRARRLAEADRFAGVCVLRTLDDALALRAELERGPRVAVVGAGFIGAEVAASCRMRGLDVAMIEPLPAPLAAALGPEIGGVCAQIHRDHGVTLHCGARVERFEGGSRIERLRLADGSAIEADVVVVGIGAAPETAWLESSGLDLDDGVVCDATSATAAPGIVAAGDVARWYNPLFGVSMRVEHWTNAVEQAGAAAERLLGGPEEARPFAPVPFVWSDQYDRKIQSAGCFSPEDEMRVVNGSFEERRFVALFGRKGRLTGAVAMNRVRQLVTCRRWIREQMSFDDAITRSEAAG